MLKLKFFSPVLFIILLLSVFVYTGCQQQEERNYTDAELQSIVDNLTQIWNGGDANVIDTIYSKDAVRHNAGINTQNGPEEIKAFRDWVYNSYSDFAVTFTDPLKTKDRAVIIWSARGTNDGPLDENMPATGKEVSFSGIGVLKIENGKITEEWQYYNQLPVYTQMGFKLVPVEEEGGEE